MEEYLVKPTKHQKQLIRNYWKRLQKLSDMYYNDVADLERDMELCTDIKGIEFFMSSDDGYVGVGNTDRSMKLIQFK